MSKLEWKDSQDLIDLFNICDTDNESKEYAILIISQFKRTDSRIYDVACQFITDPETRYNADEHKMYSLDPEMRFKNPEASIVAYITEYIVNTTKKGEIPHNNIYVVTSLGDAKKIIRKQLPKKRCKKIDYLQNLRNILLSMYTVKTVHMKNTHPYFLTSFECCKKKRERDAIVKDTLLKKAVDIELPSKF